MINISLLINTFGIDQTINNSATLHAMWSIKTYALTVQSGGNTTVSGSGTYKYLDCRKLKRQNENH